MGEHAGTAAPWWRDAAERVGWTFVEAFIGALLLADLLNVETYKAAALAGVTAALAVVKAVAAKKIGKGETAALGA